MNKFLELETLEINITSHCNLSCRSCSHFAPIAKKRNLDSNYLKDQLILLAENFRFEKIRLLGGEPLLYPDLPFLLKKVNQSKITKKIILVTNGISLPKMQDICWEYLDEIIISEYPNYILSEKEKYGLIDKADQFNIDMIFLECSSFRESYSEIGTNDQNLIQKIYHECKVTHEWKCYTLVDNYFFKCPLAYFIPINMKDKFVNDYIDGIKIHESSFIKKEISDYLNDTRPLKSCQFCLGTSGKEFPYECINKKEWRSKQQFSTEELLKE